MCGGLAANNFDLGPQTIFTKYDSRVIQGFPNRTPRFRYKETSQRDFWGALIRTPHETMIVRDSGCAQRLGVDEQSRVRCTTSGLRRIQARAAKQQSGSAVRDNASRFAGDCPVRKTPPCECEGADNTVPPRSTTHLASMNESWSSKYYHIIFLHNPISSV